MTGREGGKCASVMRMMKGAAGAPLRWAGAMESGVLPSLSAPHPSRRVLALLRVPTESVESGLAWRRVGPSLDPVSSTTMAQRVLATRSNALPNPQGTPQRGARD